MYLKEIKLTTAGAGVRISVDVDVLAARFVLFGFEMFDQVMVEVVAAQVVQVVQVVVVVVTTVVVVAAAVVVVDIDGVSGQVTQVVVVQRRRNVGRCR